MFKIKCPVQNYAWGKNGTKSIIAKLLKSSDPSFDLKETDLFAELWMGTHPSGPSKLEINGALLSSWLKDNSSAVGKVPLSYPTDDLPFLFKVLSVETALSIQAHPNKILAKELFEKFPNIYKDPNHKPEMAIALTDFECLCGFRPISEIKSNLEEFPELRDISDLTDNITLEQFFYKFAHCDDIVISAQLDKLVNRIKAEEKTSLSPIKSLILRLNDQYPNDRGVFCPLFMIYLSLIEGQSFFIGANIPHAYISGDLVECMALSDNVIRAGLTPKFKDVNTLCSMLDYNCTIPSFLDPIPLDDYTKVYRPPYSSCAEFEVELITVPANTRYSLIVVDCGALLLMIKGKQCELSSSEETMTVSEGHVIFVVANKSISVSTGIEGVVFYRAHVNLGDL